MSRSYKKNIVVNTCYGDNRDFYKSRRRKIKNAHRMQLRSLVAQYEPEVIDDIWKEPSIPMRDTWAEPTDGHYGMNRDMWKAQKKKYNRYYDNDCHDKEVNYYLKNKHNN